MLEAEWVSEQTDTQRGGRLLRGVGCPCSIHRLLPTSFRSHGRELLNYTMACFVLPLAPLFVRAQSIPKAEKRRVRALRLSFSFTATSSFSPFQPHYCERN